MKQSTRKVFKTHGWRVDRGIHYYIYFKYYHTYIRYLVGVFKLIDLLLSKLNPNGYTFKVIGNTLDLTYKFVFSRYHGKVLSPGDVTKIINVEEDVTLGPDTTKRIVPFKYAKDILLTEPNQIAVMDCPCKAALDNNPCQPLNACIAVGRPVTDFWIEHCEKYNVRKITKEEALDIIAQHRKTGHYIQIFFKVATGGRTGVICNCCQKCCGGGAVNKIVIDFVEQNRTEVIEAIGGEGDPLKGVSLMAPSGYTIIHNAEKCKKCGKCAEMCNFSVIKINDGERLYDLAHCKGCGVCEEHCPTGAISMIYEEKGGYIPLDLDLAREKLAQ